MKLQTLHDLYIDNLKDLYNAENQIIKALPKMAKAATSPQLQQAYTTHLEQTQRQIERLDQIFNELDIKPTGKRCRGMEGLIEEGQELIEENADPDVRDAGLIAAAQKVEHYEISGYGTARTYAEHLGFTKAVRLLDQILAEEKETDAKLTTLAESSINIKAER